MKTAYIVDIVRTPIGKYAGALASVRPDDLAAHVLKALISHNSSFQITDIEDVIMGAANQSGEDNRNVARMAALLAGLPLHTGGLTVNRLCASGLQAIMDAARGLMLGEGQAYIAAGVESMTRAPFVMPKAATPYARQPEIFDTTMGWRFINPRLSALHYPYTMGETAENVAKEFNISRLAQDEWAHLSQLRWKKAQEEGKFQAEITPVSVASKKNGELLFSTDEHPRLSSLEELARLKPAFVEGGTVTAGNSSGINDGAAACLLVSEETLQKYNLKPMARVVSMAVAGVSPHLMGMGPVPAVQKALNRAGLRLQDIDLVELNEAFASQVLGCLQVLGLNPEIVNVNGGSIAIGHPLGASGVRISATLLHEMQRREGVRYGLATMCIGVGQGAAIIYEKC